MTFYEFILYFFPLLGGFFIVFAVLGYQRVDKITGLLLGMVGFVLIFGSGNLNRSSFEKVADLKYENNIKLNSNESKYIIEKYKITNIDDLNKFLKHKGQK